ncbi:MAG: sigma-E factor negative regulatory protein RseA [Oceanicoccus sp.]|jgi:sigma-E factor negative regulatory protein RseA
MSEQLRESVSALMDGEADEMEVHRLLAESNKDVVQEAWSRYQSISDVMQGDSDSKRFKHIEISQKVSDAVSAESSLLVKKERKPSAFLKSIGGFAVAASVTVAVVIGMQANQPTSSGFDAISNPAISSRVYLPNNTASNVSFSGLQTAARPNALSNSLPGVIDASKVIANFEAQKRLDKFILRHTERAALNDGQGMISYARVASFDSP